MKQEIFIYRIEGIISPPFPDKWIKSLEKALKMVVTIVGKYGSSISAIHLSKREVVTYHSDFFHPTEAQIGEQKNVPIEPVGKKEFYHTYQLPVDPSGEIIEVAEDVKYEDFVFQVGVRDFRSSVVSIGVMDKVKHHIDDFDVDHFKIASNSESGSGIFTLDGKLMGMTLGHISPRAMAGTSIANLLSL